MMMNIHLLTGLSTNELPYDVTNDNTDDDVRDMHVTHLECYNVSRIAASVNGSFNCLTSTLRDVESERWSGRTNRT